MISYVIEVKCDFVNVRYYMKNEILCKDIVISDNISNVYVSKVNVFFSCELSNDGSDGSITNIEV
jgi:hypothetical protein